MRKSNSATRLLLTLCTFLTRRVSLRQETTASKNCNSVSPSQLHFNNVTSHALFYGSHLVMCSKRCAVQNQGITLNVQSNLEGLLAFWRNCLHSWFSLRPKLSDFLIVTLPVNVYVMDVQILLVKWYLPFQFRHSLLFRWETVHWGKPRVPCLPGQLYRLYSIWKKFVYVIIKPLIDQEV